jgi:outer membrane protein insertion porin family
MKFIAIFFLIVSFSLAAKTEIIYNIIVNNNERISVNTIKTYGNIKIGSNYSSDDLNDILKNLYETNFFQDVSIIIENNILIIDVVENKLIQTININGIKSKRIQDVMLEQISLKSKSPFIKSKLEKDLLTIKSSLSREGYYFSSVTSDIEDNLNNTINLNFTIDLGNKVKISKIEFTGDKIVKDKTLRNLITVEESRFWKFLSKNKYLNEQILLRDERLLKKFYLDEGYYDVVVNASTAKLLDNNRFDVIFNINAGNLYKINETKLILPIDYDIKNFQEVEKLLDEIKSENYSFYRISKIVDAIDKISLSREYDFITAEIIEEKASANKIDIIFKVSETEKLYVQEINILGNNITEESIIRNQLEVDEGDPFNELLQVKSINKIKSLNIFKSVESELIDGSNPATKIINISVEEKPTGEISLGAGVGSDGGTVGFGVSENNFLGKGIKLSTSLRLSGDTMRGNFTIRNPNFNYSGRGLSTNIESTKTDKLKESGYESSKTGFSFGTSFEEYENLYFSPSISLFSEKINTDKTASTALKKQEGSFVELKLSYSLNYDLRNKPYRPTEGTLSIFKQGIPIISDDYALLNSYEITKWYEFNNKVVADLGFFVKAINSINDEDVKISSRLSMPKTKLRGFETNKLGPVDNSDYIGGNYATSVNFNTTLPMILPTFENISFKYFLDFGNLWGVDYSDTVNESNKIRSSTGLTIDWFTPIGPLNFSLAQNLLKAKTDVTQSFQFNLGTTF